MKERSIEWGVRSPGGYVAPAADEEHAEELVRGSLAIRPGWTVVSRVVIRHGWKERS